LLHKKALALIGFCHTQVKAAVSRASMKGKDYESERLP